MRTDEERELKRNRRKLTPDEEQQKEELNNKRPSVTLESRANDALKTLQKLQYDGLLHLPELLTDLDGTVIDSRPFYSGHPLYDNEALLLMSHWLQEKCAAKANILTARSSAQVWKLVRTDLREGACSKELSQAVVDYRLTYNIAERMGRFLTTSAVMTKGDYVMPDRTPGSYFEKVLVPFEKRLSEYVASKSLLSDNEYGEWKNALMKNITGSEADMTDADTCWIKENCDLFINTKTQKLITPSELNTLVDQPGDEKTIQLINYFELLKEEIGKFTFPDSHKEVNNFRDSIRRYQQVLSYFRDSGNNHVVEKADDKEDWKHSWSVLKKRLFDFQCDIDLYLSLKVLLESDEFPAGSNDELLLQSEWDAIKDVDSSKNTKSQQALRLDNEGQLFVHIDDNEDEILESITTFSELRDGGLQNGRDLFCMRADFQTDSKVKLNKVELNKVEWLWTRSSKITEEEIKRRQSPNTNNVAPHLTAIFNWAKEYCAALKAQAAPEGVFSNPWSHNLKIISPTEVHCALSLAPPANANGGLGDKAITLDLIYNSENKTWKYKEVKIPEGLQDICDDAIEDAVKSKCGHDKLRALDVDSIKDLLSDVSDVMPTREKCGQLISQAGAQLAPMVNEFTKVSTIYSNPEFSTAKVVSPHQVSYEVVVQAPETNELNAKEAEHLISQLPPPPLHLLFTYDSRTQTWDVKPSGNAVEDVEAELRNKFLYGYVNRPLEGSFKDCYGRMTQLQQNLLDCYSYHDLLISGPLDTPEVNEEVSRKIQEKICQTMVGLNTLEDKVFELLASVAQQGYLDNRRGNVIEQLLTKEKRDSILNSEKHKGQATYDPGASTLACFGQYRSVFVGSPGDPREDPCLWTIGRDTLIEDLLKACVARVSEEGVGDADKAKAEWLGGVINLIGKVTQFKDILSPMYARLREDSSVVTGVARLCIEKAKSNWYETLKQLDQLQVKIAGEAAEQERLKLLLLVVGELDVIRLNDHNKISFRSMTMRRNAQ